MNKNDYRELMILSLYGELSEEDQASFVAYLKKHPDAKKEYQDLKKFRSFVSENTTKETADNLLHDARAQLRTALRNERNMKSNPGRFREFLTDLFRPWMAWNGAGMLSLGLLIGYCTFALTGNERSIVVQPVSDRSAETPKTSIANIRFIDSDASDGEVEFEFDAVAPMHVKGKIDNPEIQRLLTHALLNESNAGVRLSTMNAIRDQTAFSKTVDPAIKTALITSLKSDANPGVRSEALRVLQQYTFDNDIRDALLFVIAKDENSGIRVAAINALELAKMDGTRFDESTVNALKRQIENEQNNYIRNRAVNLVKEIYQ
ncbi:MAG: HEAT repeat domain-containing protein [Bacteroidetes bacterium]|nr:HEAT repeat domain-containing protein [Bacteroidota bacterium]